MYRQLIFLLILINLSSSVQAVDITSFICNLPQMTEAELTRACKGNDVSAHTICQGNEGKAWCKNAHLEINDTSILKAQIGLRNKHIVGKFFGEDIVAYNSSSTAYITILINADCKIIDSKIEFSNASAQSLQWILELFNYNLEDQLPTQIPNC